MDVSTRKYIEEHLNDDINKLALSKFPDNIDKQFVIRQIQARQLLKKKLPSWSESDELLFPRRLSLEQCSSELTAKYKRAISRKVAESQSEVTSDTICENLCQSVVENKKSLPADVHETTHPTICENLCQSVVKTKKLVDLTGGMGVDTAFLSDNFDETVYVEAQEELCELARHNFNILNKNIKVVNAKAEDYLSQCDNVDCIFLDPARRDEYGRKMVSLHDCSPDVAELQDLIFEKSKTLMVKLSPMLDIDIIKKELKNIKEIHIVAVKNECKELLVVCQQTTDNETTGRDASMIHSIKHIDTSDENEMSRQICISATDLRESWNFTFTDDEEQNASVVYADVIRKYLYEPGVACMKAAPFKLLSQRFNIKKLDRNSHLYTSDELVVDFLGRIFEVINVVNFDKKAKKIIADSCQLSAISSQSKASTSTGSQFITRSSQPKVSIAVRNFPLSAEELRKHLGFKDGDNFYIFGTTMKGEKKILILGKRILYN